MISKYYQKLFNLPIFKIGVKKATSLNDEKKIYFVNILCILQLISFIMVILIGVFFDTKLITTSALIGYAIPTISIFIVFYLQYLGIFLGAKLLSICYSFFTCLFFDVYILPEAHIGIYYITVPLVSLCIFNNKWPPLLFLTLSICLFLDVFHIKNGIDFNQIHFSVLFLVVFFSVYFLMEINKTAETKLWKQQKKLKELDEFKSHFFINLSHEIRTPLTIIKGYISRINLEDSESINKKKISTIHTQAEQIQNIIDNILDLSKLDTNKLELNMTPIVITSFLNKHFINFKELFNKKDVHFTLDLDIPNLMVNMDVHLISKSLNNLLSNALKFTPKHGAVLLKATYKNDLTISIIDTGIGIPKKDISLVFNRFYQSKNHITKSQGNGIGLAFTKSIIEAHNFKLNLESTPYVETCFSISIPKTAFYTPKDVYNTDQPFTKKNLSIPDTQNVPTNEQQILIVEDHEEMKNYLKIILQQYNIKEASNGKEAIALLKQNTFDLILTDYMMPIMDGISLVTEIKKRNIETPIIVVTARQDNQGKLDMLRLGIDTYITKPFVEEELLINIRRAIVFYKNIKTSRANISSEDNILLKDSNEKFNKDLKVFIEQNISNKSFGVNDLASHLNLSRSSLNRKTKLFLGQTPNEVITEVRLQIAKLILEEHPNIKKKDLAQKVGFYNANYFYKKLEERFSIVDKS